MAFSNGKYQKVTVSGRMMTPYNKLNLIENAKILLFAVFGE